MDKKNVIFHTDRFKLLKEESGNHLSITINGKNTVIPRSILSNDEDMKVIAYKDENTNGFAVFYNWGPNISELVILDVNPELDNKVVRKSWHHLTNFNIPNQPVNFSYNEITKMFKVNGIRFNMFDLHIDKIVFPNDLLDDFSEILQIGDRDFETTFTHRIGGIVNNDAVWSLVWSGIEGTKPVLIKFAKSTAGFAIRRVDLSYTKYIFREEKFNRKLLAKLFSPDDHEVTELYIDKLDLYNSAQGIYDVIANLVLLNTDTNVIIIEKESELSLNQDIIDSLEEECIVHTDNGEWDIYHNPIFIRFSFYGPVKDQDKLECKLRKIILEAK